MILDDFIPEDFLRGQFEELRQHVLQKIPQIEISLEIINEDRRTIRARRAEIGKGDQRYQIEVSKRFVNYISRYFFAFARCVDRINSIDIPDPQPSGIPYPFYSEIHKLEGLLNEIPDESELSDERVEIYIHFLSSAWHFLLYHEMAHILRGHIAFVEKHKDLFLSDPGYVIAFEIEADDFAASALTRRVLLAPEAPKWLTMLDVTENARFLMLVVCSLFLGARTDISPVERYPPFDVRTFLAVSVLSTKPTWQSERTRAAALISALTESSRISKLIARMPAPQKPVIVVEKTLEEIITGHLAAQSDYDRLSPTWQEFVIRAN